MKPTDETPTHDVGGTDPAPDKVSTARRLVDLHRDIGIPRNSFCGWCLKPWPCAEVRWAKVVLARASRPHDLR